MNTPLQDTKQILVATLPTSTARVKEILSGHFEFTCVTSFDEACKHIRPGLGLVMCTLTFDNERMFDLLRFLKGNSETQAIPFICIQSTDIAMTATMVQGIEIALRSVGAERLVPLFDWQKKFGPEAAAQKMRLLIDQVLNPVF